MSSRLLEHKRILLTRSEEHLQVLDKMLCARGAVAVHFPCLQIEVLSDAVMQAAASITEVSDVVFTSANGVHALASQDLSLATLLQGRRVAAVGNKTAAALRDFGVRADIMPELESQDGLIAAYAQRGLPRSLLFVRAEEGRDALSEALRRQAVPVQMALLYRTICPLDDASDIIHSVASNQIDAVLLGSPKTALHYIERLGSVALADKPVVVVISESMAIAVRNMGLSVQVVAKHASFEAMLDALAECFESHKI
ncbi:uroporphyrinogen-III synthase [Mariprofundus sp. EBB-1]|uniref:uroporphyrinogen-III synthase n=1 Tax=Mariprofundus sp. EBB-1 TaxID=2650971 RepID=UPI000EF20B4A|nr:uroporphyrinogen-III synthase [Mariprofundus sp. EBB-1]RLL52154.1 uroporphyrinogen-III synthase [Mariprofundus sp. EBB-1]